MDYTPGATHIAKWQWDLVHDPGVILRVFERDEDAMWGQLTNQKHFIRAGRINYQSWVSQYPSMKNMLTTKAINDFISKFDKTKSNISDLIFENEYGASVAKTSISFIADTMRNANMKETHLFSIEDLNETQYQNAKVALKVTYVQSAIKENDIAIAHEFLIHGILFVDEINKLDFKKLNLKQAADKISDIYMKSRYVSDDDGSRDHVLFMTGEKKEMTDFLLDRLKSMKTEEQRSYLRKILIGDVGSFHNYVNKDTKLINNYKKGKEDLLIKIKLYLETDFNDYHDLIFKPLPCKTTSLWDIITGKKEE
jgi:hypothetical protein